ncbi:hypothetical protein FRX31_027592 [Thalictrum thalictroides]|uniref:Uncharacterized protein n=1 Tax=Thalictrum thalictroides TaxID=46969 RepID=A0A7J6VER0_THATH|nr:hypothetical protein FRX31_027592 [Thalictrum thalictroides]
MVCSKFSSVTFYNDINFTTSDTNEPDGGIAFDISQESSDEVFDDINSIPQIRIVNKFNNIIVFVHISKGIINIRCKLEGINDFCTWERAEPGEYTLQGSSGGWATVIRDPNSEVVAATHGKSKYYSTELIELNALEQGLQLTV